VSDPSVVEFGMLLRGSKHAGTGSFQSALARARVFRGDDPEGYRAEFIKLSERAEQLREAERRAGTETRR
jgi:Ca-activated chloride channel family protein